MKVSITASVFYIINASENIFWLRRCDEIARTLPRPKSRMEEQPNFSLETWSTKFRDCYRYATSKSFVGCPRQIPKISDDAVQV